MVDDRSGAAADPAPAHRRESAWDYPRPPRVEPSDRHIRVVVGGVTVADSRRALRVLETSHPPAWYIPREDVRMDLLEATPRRSVCEYKGTASYLRLRDGRAPGDDVAWTYERPAAGYAAISGHIAFYPGRVDEAWVDAERASPQPGDFYGGWVTSELDGPFKGEPGSLGW